MVFKEKSDIYSDNHARCSNYRRVYALLISFLKQFKISFSSYRACSKESFGLSIFLAVFEEKYDNPGRYFRFETTYVPKKVLVKKDIKFLLQFLRTGNLHKKLFTGRTSYPGRSRAVPLVI